MRQFCCLLLCACLAACAPSEETQEAAQGPAQRIVSLAPNITELVYAAGAGSKLGGVVEYSDFPPEARELPRIGDSFRIDYEALRQLEPDLVLAWESGNPAEIVSRIRSLGYRVVTLEPRSLDSIADAIAQIGELAGTQARAAAAERAFRAELAGLKTMSAAGQEPLSVFWQISADPYFTVTGDHVISEVIELCGGRNIFADLPGLAPPVSLEAILAARPEVVIASVPPGDDEWKTGWRRWESIPAVAGGNLYSVHPDLVSRSGPRMVQGAAAVCAALEKARGR